MQNTPKPLKGEIHHWYRVYFDKEQYREIIPEETLGYIVVGLRNDSNMMKTSPVISYDPTTNQIETLNSLYTLVGEGGPHSVL